LFDYEDDAYTSAFFLQYSPEYDSYEKGELISCGITDSAIPAVFYSSSPATRDFLEFLWLKPANDSIFVNGFFAGCNPFEALLKSTLDCLYESDCLQLFNEYFPSLNETNLTDYILLSNNKTNSTVYDHLFNLFIDEWTIKVNYSEYFQNCNPSMCTYTATSKINYSYTINLFISLYGGLIIILRMISPFLIKILFKINRFSLFILLTNSKTYLQRSIQSIKCLNLFKLANQRTENEIRQQRWVTRVYLILLMSTIATLLLFNSLSMETTTISIPNPSLSTYIHLQKSNSHTLRCPCSTMTISNEKFMSFSPVLHQICSSDFVTDQWLEILKQSATRFSFLDWRNSAYQEFSLLSKICQLANETITNVINEFFLQSFVVSNVLTEIDFNIQIEKVLSQFYQSTIVYFQHLIDAVSLHIQVDQPFMIKYATLAVIFDTSSIQNITTDQIAEV